jgi:tetratricopeptide (TPR) repeat protein
MFRQPVNTVMAVILIGSLTVTSSSCGNAWITSRDREKTTAALMSKGDYAYDKSRFDEAADYFSQALAKDSSNTDARIKLSYALNGKAGLNILDFVTKFIVKEEVTTPTPAPAQPGTTTTTTTSSSNPIEILTKTVGLNDAEAKEIGAQAAETIVQLREFSKKFSTLNESWTNICSLLPAELVDSVFEIEPASLKVQFEIEKCKGGMPAGSAIKSAALFAAALQFMAQAAGLFQAILDKDGNNEIDIAEKGVAALAQLESLQKKTTEFTDATAASDYGNNLSAINAQLEVIRALRKTISGEMIPYTLACFTFITRLVAQIPNIPKEIASKIEKAASKVNEGRAKLALYSNYDPTSPNASQGTKVKEAATKASQTIDALYTKANAITDPAEKQARIAELDKNKEAVCTNFEATKKDFNLPADIQAPSNCQTVSLLMNDPAPLSQRIESKVTYFDSYKSINALNQSHSSHALSNSADDDSETNERSNSAAFTEFVMLGEELIR